MNLIDTATKERYLKSLLRIAWGLLVWQYARMPIYDKVCTRELGFALEVMGLGKLDDLPCPKSDDKA